jgi:hypothetical protein
MELNEVAGAGWGGAGASAPYLEVLPLRTLGAVEG